MKTSTTQRNRSLWITLLLVYGFVLNGFSADHVTMSTTNCSAGTNYVQFDIVLLNDGTTPLKFNSTTTRIVLTSAMFPGGSTVTLAYQGGSLFPASFATLGTSGTYNITPSSTLSAAGTFTMTSSAGDYNSGTAISLPAGVTVNMGTFRLTNSQGFTPGLTGTGISFNSSTGVVLYANGSGSTSNFNTTANRTLGTFCSVTIPAACTTPIIATQVSGVSGCSGSTTGTITVNQTGGTAATGYLWSNGAVTSSITGVGAGTYTVTVTAGSCSAISTGTINDGPVTSTYYADADGDGFGNPAVTQSSCTGVPSGYVSNNGDCNDNNAAVHPGATEVCNGVDDNCDGLVDNGLTFITYYTDADHDGYGVSPSFSFCSNPGVGYSTVLGDCNDNDATVHVTSGYYLDNDNDGFGAGSAVQLCSASAPAGYSSLNTDCNDNNAAINPNAAEVCNGIDDNCNGSIDEGLTFVTYYVDADADGYGAGTGSSLCSNPGAGYSTNNTDCNDANSAIHPGATEICNGIDDNCNGLADEGLTFVTYYKDNDGDGFGNAQISVSSCNGAPATYVADNTDCNDNDASVHATSGYFVDNDNDGFGAGVAVQLCSASAPSGYSSNSTDCNDNDATVHAPQSYFVDADHDGYGSTTTALVCSSVATTGYSTNNTDCNDNDASVHATSGYYVDGDGDGFGAGVAVQLCSASAPSGYSSNNTDCNDGNAAINPNASEVCNGIDDNCNGSVDEGLTFVTYYVDADGDGFGAGSGSSLCSNPGAGYSTNNTDCNDNNAAINPGASEVCNGIDDNCNGTADEGLVFVTYYHDLDGDGFGAGVGSSLCSNPGAGYVTNNTDCNDNDASVNTPQSYFVDADHDGFGSTTTALVCSSVATTGYSTNNTDCNDNDASVHAPQSYFVDADHDGFGSTTTALLCSSTAPVGYSTNNTDCNDNDASVHTPQPYYLDNDGDNYGAGSVVMLCSSTAPNGYSVNNTDCNDNNANIYPTAPEQCNGIDDNCDGLVDNGVVTSTFYQDLDNDGVGNSAVSVVNCAAPAGYVLTPGDCNDNDASVQSPQSYFVDADHDGFGSTATALLCSSTAPVGYSTNNTDCNDNDASVHTPQPYYVDADGDGFGAGSVVSLCSSTAPAGYSTNNTDCNDNDASVHAPQSYFVDADGDGFGSTTTALVCSSVATAGYSTNNTDCNDNDASVHAPQSYFVDADLDGFGSSTTALVCSSVATSGYSTNNTDCNDNDASVHAPQSYFVDADHDGFGSTATALVCSSVATSGYSTNNTDCNDNDASVHAPQSYFVDADGDGFGSTATALVCSSVATAGYSTNNTDCNDNDATVNTPQSYFVDADHDGFGSTTTALVCSSTATAGYSTNNTDCNDNDATVNAPQSYFVDADHDGFGSTTTALVCSSVATSGYSTNNTDCNDGNASINPSASEVCNGIDDNCNGSVDEGLTFATYYADLDGDGYGNFANSVSTCNGAPLHYVSDNTDCNDAVNTIHPGATEVCGNGIDDNCNGLVDEGCAAGCTNAPTANAGSGGSVCTGNTISLNGSIGGGATNGTWSSSGSGSFANVNILNTVYTPSSADYTAGSVTLTLTTDAPTGCTAAVSNVTYTFTALPSPIGPISGTSAFCNPSASGTYTYSVAPVSGITTYTWTVPANTTIVSGQGTPTIVVSWSQVAIHNGIIGTISVVGNNGNGCGSAVPSTLGISVQLQAPVTPPSISGSPAVCPGDVVSYSIALVARAGSYTWSVPTGAQILSGQNTNMISVQYNAAFIGGNMSVIANNGCGSSSARLQPIIRNVLPASASITGPVNGVCNLNGVVYTAASITGASSYVWTVPSGATIVGSASGSSITVNFGTISSGAVTVAGVNNCGSGAVRSLTVTGTPAQAGVITGPVSVCVGTQYVYSVATVAGASNYAWTVSSRLSIVSGQGSKNLTASGVAPGSNVTVNVTASNSCGTSPNRQLAGITVAICPRVGTAEGTLSLSVYPNPVTDLMNVSFNSEKAQDYTVRMLDATGRVVMADAKTAAEGENKVEMSVKGLASGIYMLQFQMGDHTEQMRIYVN